MSRSRVAVVTGASGGIGRAIAVALGGLGWSVALGARAVDRLEATAVLVRDQGGVAFAHGLDVTKPESVDSFFTAAEAEFGRIDVLVNNAGIAIPGFLVDTEPDGLSREITTNLLGPLLCCRRVLPTMQTAHSGDIIFISSDAATNPRPGLIAYSASKAALETVAAVIGMETEGTGIRTTVVRVGPTVTDFAGDWEPGTFEHLLSIWPRFGIQRHFETMNPADIAAAVVHALTAPPHARVAAIEMQPVAPLAAPE